MTLALLLAASLLAQSTNPAPTLAPEAKEPREISPGVFDYHGVRLDKKNRRVTFDATVNQREGVVEYVLVNEKGKTHESLLATKVAPHDIHVALLLIGLKEDKKSNISEPLPPSAIDSAYLHAAPKLKGPPVHLSLAWKQDGKLRQTAAEDWIFNLHTNKLMSPGAWTYNGSLVEDGQFLADAELSIVAVVTDPTALANNPRDGYDNDQIWRIQTSAVPALKTPVEVTITLDQPEGHP